MDFQFLLVAVNAKYIHSNPAIYSLRAYAGEELRQYVGLAEYTINQPMAEILADIYARKPDAIGFSCYIWNWRLVQELLGEIPKVLPGARIWLGGPEVTYDADVILRRYPWLSGIMVGEGEATFRELLAYYVKGQAAQGRDLRRGRGPGKAYVEPGNCLRRGRTGKRQRMEGGGEDVCRKASCQKGLHRKKRHVCLGNPQNLRPGNPQNLCPGNPQNSCPGNPQNSCLGNPRVYRKSPVSACLQAIPPAVP